MEAAVDRATFDRLLLGELAALQRFATRLCGRRDLADDVAQETVVRAARSWRTYRGTARFRTWLFQIAVNAFRDLISRPRIVCDLPADVPDREMFDPSRQIQAAEIGAVVARLVSSLPPRQREVLVLVSYEQMPMPQVAQVLGISEQNVRTTLHVARQKLKERLAPYFSNEKSR